MQIAVYNNHKPMAVTYAEQFICKAKQLSIDCLAISHPSQLASNKFDFIAVFGGDGTVLTFAFAASQFNIPIIAFNVGKIGFLTTVDVSCIDQFLNNLISNNYQLIYRDMLEASIKDSPTALNEIIVCSSTIGRAINLQLYINNILISDIVGDGVIISTNSGSTAYSLSAGGAIISPSVNATIITPLCPHSLKIRPIIISSSDEISIVSANASIIIDGVNICNIDGKLNIKSSVNKCKFIEINNTSFYSKLCNKLF